MLSEEESSFLESPLHISILSYEDGMYVCVCICIYKYTHMCVFSLSPNLFNIYHIYINQGMFMAFSVKLLSLSSSPWL